MYVVEERAGLTSHIYDNTLIFTYLRKNRETDVQRRPAHMQAMPP